MAHAKLDLSNVSYAGSTILLYYATGSGLSLKKIRQIGSVHGRKRARWFSEGCLSTYRLSRGAGTIGTTLAETPCGLKRSLHELFNIQSIPEIVVTRLSPAVSTSKNLYKHRQVYRPSLSSSPNKGSITLYTFQLHCFLLCYSVLSIVVSGSFSLPCLLSASNYSTY
jgi:hypothetical protein